MSENSAYPIGTPGQPWDDADRAEWLVQQSIRRSYADEVLDRIMPLGEAFDIIQYGSLSIDPERYPLIALSSRTTQTSLPTVLVTGGVHGYETSGVQGAIRFLHTAASSYSGQFNLVVAPCVSPWGYETINRWNPGAVDPNRSFHNNSPSEEAASLMQFVASLNTGFLCHIDLHETTDTDNTEFRPALAARDAVTHENWHIPDGFYSVDDSEHPTPDFQAAVIESVEQVTHIAPPDPDGRIIGETLQQHGVIHYAARKLGLCMSVTEAPFVTTTEVYPDSPRVDDENCIVAQVAAITGGLDYLAGR